MSYPWETDAYKQAMQALNPFPKRVIDEATKNDILEEQAGQYVLIGHTLKYCNELENTLNEATTLAEKYYNLGVEKGYIVPQKSTEDMLLEAMNAIKYLADKVEQLESKRANPVMVNPVTEIIAETEVIGNGAIGNGDEFIVRDKPANGTKGKK